MELGILGTSLMDNSKLVSDTMWKGERPKSFELAPSGKRNKEKLSSLHILKIYEKHGIYLSRQE